MKHLMALARVGKPLSFLLTSLVLANCTTQMSSTQPSEWTLAIHGGAGVITKESMTPELEAAYHAALARSLEAGGEILANGGSSLDAVQAAIIIMEDDSLFNAGLGAVFTADGGHELDASIMSGVDRDAGAVAGVKRVRNPILAARAVMDKSRHVMFAGQGADDFAAAQGLDMVETSYFDTERRRQSLLKVLSKPVSELTVEERHGTVGAVAIDQSGNIAAGTSTGGMTAKMPGRVGDSPLIGAATYAQNGVCAVSATGHGEYFIRVGVAKTICTRVELLGEDIKTAAEHALGQVASLGGDGGVVLLGANGEVAYAFNSPGMYRGSITASATKTEIYGDSE